MNALAIVRALVKRHENRLDLYPNTPAPFESELATVCSAIFDRADASLNAVEMALLKAIGVPRSRIAAPTTER